MRVIAGKLRSRRLRSLRGADVRPTSDRLRETLFNVLTGGNPDALNGSVWLDLYAGTGAVGIEALSRGAGMVFFVESSLAAAGLIAQNLRSVGLETGFRILRQEITRALRNLEAENIIAYFIFIDAPYRLEHAYRETLLLLSDSKLLEGKAVVGATNNKPSNVERDI